MNLLRAARTFIFPLLIVSSYSAAAWADEFPGYAIQAAVDPVKKEIAAVQTVTYTNLTPSPLNEIYFYIYPNREYSAEEKEFMLLYSAYFKVNPYPDGFEDGLMDIRSVKSHGKDFSYQIEGEDKTLLKVALPAPLGTGETVTLTLDFRVKIPHAYGRFGWHEDIIKLSRWYPVLCVLDENGWHLNPSYPFHRPFYSDAANYSVALTVPADQQVVHSGILKEEGTSGSTKTLTINSTSPIREFTFAMSPRYKLLEETAGGIKFKSYYLPGDEFHAKAALKDAQDLFKFYTERFGTYPYPEFSIVPVHLGYGGEQMSNMVFIDTRVYKLPKFLMRYFDFLISHESGHQWFYNLVGMDEYSEMWLEEGVHSYFIAEYLDNKYGANAMVIDFPHWLKKWEWVFPELTFKRTRDVRYKIISRIKGFDHAAVGKLSSFQEPSSIFSVTYGKGSRIVQMLRAQIGEEAFKKVFTRIFAEFRFKILDIDSFLKICEAESGKDLAKFFQDWLYTDKKLNFAVQGVKGNEIRLENLGEIVMPVDIEVTLKSGEKQMLEWDGANPKETIAASGPVAKVAIDPDNDQLDIDRINNFWPRQIQLKPVPYYWPLYDISVFQPEDAYRVIAGPEIISNGIGVKASVQKVYDQIFYMGTGYEFGESLHTSRVGYELKNVMNRQTAVGFEIANRTDLDGGEEDLVTGKVYIRRELWPAKYSVTDINDHVSLYLIRNRGLDGSLTIDEREDSRNLSYLRRDEAIVGTNVHFGRAGPSPDPRQGFISDMILENSGHFLNATQYFTRGAVDISAYQPVTAQSHMAYRFKAGLGYPDDKNLFQLGGFDGLRGFDRKTVRGANALLSSVEYRFPLIRKMGVSLLDNLFGIEAVSGVVFADVGQSWFSSFPDSDLKKDAGAGLRVHMNIGSFFEKVILRADVAQAINEDGEDDPHFWFGINHAF